MRFRLRTLMMALAFLPPFLAFGWWRYSEWRANEDRRAAIEAIDRERFEVVSDLVSLMQAPPLPPWSKEYEAKMVKLQGRAIELGRQKTKLGGGQISE
jgi:hypothetical protein